MKLQRIALAVALAIAAGPAAALGLGQIQVKSKIDQPLLAEIPIISSDPAELEQLQARLASPDTFARIGLEPPTGAAAAALELRGLESITAAIEMRIGIAYGRLRSGTYGHKDRQAFTCLGDQVNLASRLMSKAPSGP